MRLSRIDLCLVVCFLLSALWFLGMDQRRASAQTCDNKCRERNQWNIKNPNNTVTCVALRYQDCQYCVCPGCACYPRGGDHPDYLCGTDESQMQQQQNGITCSAVCPVVMAAYTEALGTFTKGSTETYFTCHQ